VDDIMIASHGVMLIAVIGDMQYHVFIPYRYVRRAGGSVVACVDNRYSYVVVWYCTVVTAKYVYGVSHDIRIRLTSKSTSKI
jgi:hypothetical protein